MVQHSFQTEKQNLKQREGAYACTGVGIYKRKKEKDLKTFFFSWSIAWSRSCFLTFFLNLTFSLVVSVFSSLFLEFYFFLRRKHVFSFFLYLTFFLSRQRVFHSFSLTFFLAESVISFIFSCFFYKFPPQIKTHLIIWGKVSPAHCITRAS